MDSFTIQLVESVSDHPGWFVQVDQCGPHDYQYLLVEQLAKANKTYTGGKLLYPEPYIALQFAIAQMKQIRRARGLI